MRMLTFMPQSLSRLILHVIFSTKDREPLLLKPVRTQMHAYLATVVRSCGCDCYRVGGVADHVHIALLLSRTMTVAQLVENMKTSTSLWLKTQSSDLRNFSWQRGYGAFSIGQTDCEQLLRYIDHQEEHHQQATFQDEYRSLLEKNQIAYKEQYLWD